MGKQTNSVTDLAHTIENLHRAHSGKVTLVLIGGCSRTGKSTLAERLKEKLRKNNLSVLVVNIDAWLIGIDQRKPETTVLERYDINMISTAIEKLIQGREVRPPVYNVVSRKRINGRYGKPLFLSSGIFIVEGVVGLAIPDLLSKSSLNIFTETTDLLRLERMMDFYKNVKKLHAVAYKKIILSREAEEVPFIKNSAKNADVIFQQAL